LSLALTLKKLGDLSFFSDDRRLGNLWSRILLDFSCELDYFLKVNFGLFDQLWRRFNILNLIISADAA